MITLRLVLGPILIGLLVSSLSSASAAQTRETDTVSKPCLDRKRTEALRNRFTWSSKSGSGLEGQTLEDMLCDPEGIVYKIFKALIDLEDLPRLASNGDAFDQGILGPSVTGFIRERVQEFIFDSPDSEGCAEGLSAYVIGHPITPSVYICPAIKEFSSQVLMETLAHEARHLDGHGFRHALCTSNSSSNFLLGRAACDPSYDYKGSYGVSAEFNVRASRTSALPIAQRQEARAEAINTFLTRFNKAPLGLRSGFLIQSADGPVHFYDLENKPEPIFKNASAASVLSLDFLRPALVEPETAKFYFYNFRSESDIIDIEEASEKNSIDSLRDMIFSPLFNCWIYKDELVCWTSDQVSRMRLDSIVSLQFISIGDRFGFSAADGFIYWLPQDVLQIQDMRVGDLEKTTNPNRYTSFVKFNSKLYFGVNTDGVLLKSSSWQERPTVVAPFQTRRFKKVLGPILWSKKLEEL